MAAGPHVKPVRGAPDIGFLGMDFGRSTSTAAESGVPVSFTTSFTTAPRVAIAQHQKDVAWIDPATVTTSGFTWYGDTNVAGIDWIAIGT